MKKIDPQTREVIEKGTMQLVKMLASITETSKRMWEFITADPQRFAEYMEFEIERNAKKEDSHGSHTT